MDTFYVNHFPTSKTSKSAKNIKLKKNLNPDQLAI